MIHGVSSALAMTGSSSAASNVDPGPVNDMPIIVSSPPVEIPSMDKDVLMTTTSVYEDISDEDTNAGLVAAVCRVSCQESNSGALKENEEIVEADDSYLGR